MIFPKGPGEGDFESVVRFLPVFRFFSSDPRSGISKDSFEERHFLVLSDSYTLCETNRHIILSQLKP